MVEQIDKSKPGWWAQKQEALNPKIKTKADKILERLEEIQENTKSGNQLAKDIHFIAKALKVWIGLTIVGLIIWIGYLFIIFS